MSTSSTVGVVGIGLIGTALARRLIGAGFAVVGHDVDASKRQSLAAVGGEGVATLAAVGRGADRILVSVFDTDQVEEVIEGDGGLRDIAAQTGRDKLVLVVSTCDPDRIARLAERLAGGPVRLLEVPISGTSAQVAAGDGVGLIGGNRSDADDAADILAAICKTCHFMGAAGNGGRTKLAVNLILGINRTGLAEGLVFADALGLPLPAFLDAAKDSAAYSQIMDVKGERMIAGEFSPQGRVVQATKDVRLMMQAAAAAGQQLPLGRTYLDILEKAIAAGDGDLDKSAVMREIQRRKG
jgi:3-hydroxyisobutyrate dehydrogenase-like beta-hydroxyacid dehydrogenase